MGSPHFKGLDADLRSVFEDSRLLDRVIRGVQSDLGVSYVAALERFQGATESAHSVDGTPTLRVALDCARADADYIAESLTLLDRRDAAIEGAYQRAAPAELERDPEGYVLLDQPDGSSTADLGVALADPAERARRLSRARKAGFYVEPDEKELFEQQDRILLERHKDLVRSIEADAEKGAAQQAAAAVARQLDQAFHAAEEKCQKLKLLEAQLSELGDDVPGVSTGRADLRSQIAAARAEPVKLLDQLSGNAPALDVAADSHLRILAQAYGAVPAEGDTDTDLKVKLLNVLRSSVRTKLTSLEYAEDGGYHTMDEIEGMRRSLTTLDERAAELHGQQLVERAVRARAPAAPAVAEVPPGVDPVFHRLDVRIRERMRLLDRQDDEYMKTFQEILAGKVSDDSHA